MKLLLDQGERARHGLETQVVELQDKLKQARVSEPAKEMLMKVGSRVGNPVCSSFQLDLPEVGSPAISPEYREQVVDYGYPLVYFQTDSVVGWGRAQNGGFHVS